MIFLDTVGEKKPNQITFQTEALHVSFTCASNSTNYSNSGLCAFQWFVKTICWVFSSFFCRASFTYQEFTVKKTFTKTIHTTTTVWAHSHGTFLTDATYCTWSLLASQFPFHEETFLYINTTAPQMEFIISCDIITTLSLSIHYFCPTRVEQHSRIVWLVTLATQCLNPRDKDSETILQWAVNWDRSFCFVHKVPFWSSSLKASSKRSLFFTLKPSKRKRWFTKLIGDPKTNSASQKITV